MKKTVIAAILGMSVLVVAQAGTISGTIKAKAPVAAVADPSGDSAYDSRKYKFVEKIDYDNLKDFVVYINQPVAEPAPASPGTVAVTTQKDANFDPHVLPIVVGTTVLWKNMDDIFHNVFAMSDAKEFDLGFYKKEKTPAVPFDKVGRVDVFCAIHAKMHCIVLVLPNTHFATADAKGRFTIKDVPPGTYKMRAWHELLPPFDFEIVVPADGGVTKDIVMSVATSTLPKY